MGKPYCELGKLLDSIARKRDVRGPYCIARRINAVAGYEISGQAVSRYFYGSSWPGSDFMGAFVQTFDLSEGERHTLARFYTYGDTY